MILPDELVIGVASYKGGVCKTATAWHVAGYLSQFGETVLFDGDANESATAWAAESADHALPFDVEPIEAAAMVSKNYRFRVLDTGQAPEESDLSRLAQNCDLLIVPTLLCHVDAKGLGKTIKLLRSIRKKDGSQIRFKVLLSRVAPDEKAQVADMREELGYGNVPVFSVEIPRLKAFAKAQAKGLLVRDVDDPRAAVAWDAFVRVGQELLA